MPDSHAIYNNQNFVKELFENIKFFEENFPLDNFRKCDFKQHPLITLLTCSDARMPVDAFGRLFNRIFCVENIGNQVKTSEGSILYGLLHLHTPFMVIAGHTDCGAIKAATSNFVGEPLGIRNELSLVKDSLDEIAFKSRLTVNDDSAWSELNVDMQIEYLLANRQVASLINNNKLLVMGFFVDLHNVHGNGYGKIYTINVNGKRDVEGIRDIVGGNWIDEKVKRLTNY